MSQSDNDDIWAESSDDEGQITYERNLAEREWERLQDDHGNVCKIVNTQNSFEYIYVLNSVGFFYRLVTRKVLLRVKKSICKKVSIRDIPKALILASKLVDFAA